MLIDRAGLRAPRAVGVAGSALIAVFGGPSGAAVIGVYCGLALLALGWWWYGRSTPTVREAAATLVLWAAPMLVAPPLFSRDVYSYLAQGRMPAAGLDVYRAGPAALGGPLAAEVPAIWQHTPSPYGPVFLTVARVTTAVTGDDPRSGLLVRRIVATGGLALLAAGVVVLARSLGADPAGALWLAVLNPLVLIHLIGGAHNDALMVGLLTAGLALAVRHRPVLATVLVTAATLVKAPAALGLPAVAAIWAMHLRSGTGRGGARAFLAVGAVAAAGTVVLTRIAGTGYGWITALSAPISPGNWSPTTLLGRWTATLITHDDVGAALAVQLWRWAGILATLVVAALVVVHWQRLGPLPALGVVLLALVAFGPAFRPWYLIWGLVPLAAAGYWRRALALVSTALLPVVLPHGFAPRGDDVVLAVIGALTGIGLYLGVRIAVRPAGVRAVR